MSVFKNDSIIGFITLIIFILGLFLGSMIGFNAGMGLKETEAIRVGVAQWVGDKGGKPQFKWKETQK